MNCGGWFVYGFAALASSFLRLCDPQGSFCLRLPATACLLRALHPQVDAELEFTSQFERMPPVWPVGPHLANSARVLKLDPAAGGASNFPPRASNFRSNSRSNPRSNPRSNFLPRASNFLAEAESNFLVTFCLLSKGNSKIGRIGASNFWIEKIGRGNWTLTFGTPR